MGYGMRLGELFEGGFEDTLCRVETVLEFPRCGPDLSLEYTRLLIGLNTQKKKWNNCVILRMLRG